MPFTVEELDQMQEDLEKGGSGEGAVKTPEELAAETKAAEDAKAAEDKKVADEAAAAKAAKDAEAAKAGEKTPDQIAAEEAAAERQEKRDTERELRAHLEKVTRDNERLIKVLKDKGLIGEDEEEAEKAKESEAKAAYEARVASLDNILETMRVNPAFEDVDEVVSQSNFDDMVEGLAKFYAEKNPGTDAKQAAVQITKEIWSLPNPYKYMYNLVKQHHPKFAKKEETAEEKTAREAKEAEEKKKKEEKKPEEKVDSLQNLPAGDTGAGGWTAARIDAMEEDQLHTVPKDIYERWLKGTLK